MDWQEEKAKRVPFLGKADVKKRGQVKIVVVTDFTKTKGKYGDEFKAKVTCEDQTLPGQRELTLYFDTVDAMMTATKSSKTEDLIGKTFVVSVVPCTNAKGETKEKFEINQVL